MTSEEPRWIPVEISGHPFERINLEHPEVGGRVVDEMESGVDVYYDRRWRLTRRFCRFLLDRPELVEGRSVFVAGAGVGMESVVAGRLGGSVTVNDLAPVALELCVEQLERNGVVEPGVAPGPFQDAELDGIDLVMACFVIYDEETGRAMSRLLERAGKLEIPALLANQDLGGHFSEVLSATDRPVRDLDPDGKDRFVWVAGRSEART